MTARGRTRVRTEECARGRGRSVSGVLDCGRATKDRPGPIPGLRVNMFRRCSVGEVLIRTTM
jgi:hypothetical protein